MAKSLPLGQAYRTGASIARADPGYPGKVRKRKQSSISRRCKQRQPRYSTEPDSARTITVFEEMLSACSAERAGSCPGYHGGGGGICDRGRAGMAQAHAECGMRSAEWQSG